MDGEDRRRRGARGRRRRTRARRARRRRDRRSKATQKRLPIDWDERAKRRAAEAERYGASASGGFAANATANANAATSPELALVRVATNACESLAAVLDRRLISLPEEDRAAFAAAVKRSLERVVKCR